MSQPTLPSVLVIGGMGYIGRNLLPCLIGRASTVTVLSRSSRTAEKTEPEVAYVRGNFADSRVLIPLLERHDIVVHLAYATVPNTSFDDPLADLQQNLPPVVGLFAHVANLGKRLIFVSSGGTVYGESLVTPITEQHPTHPISPYGVTKLTLENYAHLYAVTHGLQYICVRPSNAFGPGQPPFVGQGFIATAMASAMRGQSVKIFGQRGSIRDYLYISDLAEAVACLIMRGEQGQTYNLGTGQGRSNMDVIEAMSPLLQEFGYSLQVEHLPERPFDVKANVLDTQKIQMLTGWKPRISFDQGLRLTYEWLKHQGF